MSGKRAGRRPDPSVEPAIRQATLELMMERGFDLTFDEVAERAGVGRTTVFRRYATKQELISAAAQRFAAQVEFPDTGSLRSDLTGALTLLFDIFSRPPMRFVAPHLLAAAVQRKPGGDVLHKVLERRLEMVTGLLERAVHRGELPDPSRAPLVADLISGILMARMATGAPLPEEQEIQELVPVLAVAAGEPS